VCTSENDDSVEVAQLLIDKGIDIYTTNIFLRTALDCGIEIHIGL